MSRFKNKYGEWALVAGAALGLGEAYCKALAKEGMNIILIDNQEVAAEKLSQEITSDYNIETVILKVDLFHTSNLSQIIKIANDKDCRLLIYNAAFSQIKQFTEHTADELEHFLNVNMGSQLKLIHLFSKLLINKQQKGGIILMSSLAGLLGMQLIAPYAASKAFAWNLAEALHYELKPHRIDVMACIAGATATEAYLQTNPKYGLLKPQVQHPSAVANTALKKLGKRALFISGFSNRVNYFILTRLLPRKYAGKIANKTMASMYPKA